MNSRNENNPLTPALAAGGALLLFISLLLNWFSLDASGDEVPQNLDLPGIARPDTATLLLALAAGTALIIAIGRFRGSIRGLSTVLAGLGAACFLYVLATIIKKPQLLDLVESGIDAARDAGADVEGELGIGLDIGIWIALLGSLLLLAAGVMEMLASDSGPSRGPGAGAGAAPSPGIASPGSGGPLGGAPAGATPSPTATVGAPTPADPSPGWKPDPYGQAQQRYWDGASWTQHTG